MKLLLSNFGKANYKTHSKTREIWDKNLKLADSIKIATGYISSGSLIELAKIVELNQKPKIDLLIGMHFFSGFTKPQYDSALELHNILQKKGRGSVYISNSIMFHGKLYSFTKSENSKDIYSAIVGSSNIGSMFKSSFGLYEADCYFQDDKCGKLVHETILNLHRDIGVKISEVSITSFNKNNDLLEDHYGVVKVSHEELVKVRDTKTSTVFNIPVKTEPKSNLNAFFGRGRKSPRGFVVPRPWYEAELIVPFNITKIQNYPRDRSINVYTDDGWSFKCATNGQNAKNFRSLEDLQILGRWIKGRLELSGALKIGQPVTDDVLRNYGNNTVKLTATSDPNVWLLDFTQNTK